MKAKLVVNSVHVIHVMKNNSVSTDEPETLDEDVCWIVGHIFLKTTSSIRSSIINNQVGLNKHLNKVAIKITICGRCVCNYQR